MYSLPNSVNIPNFTDTVAKPPPSPNRHYKYKQRRPFWTNSFSILQTLLLGLVFSHKQCTQISAKMAKLMPHFVRRLLPHRKIQCRRFEAMGSELSTLNPSRSYDVSSERGGIDGFIPLHGGDCSYKSSTHGSFAWFIIGRGGRISSDQCTSNRIFQIICWDEQNYILICIIGI